MSRAVDKEASMIKYACAIAVSVLCMGSLIICGCRKAASNKDSRETACPIVFDQTEINVGSVYAESLPFQGSFFFTNRSAQTIELSTKACCGAKLEFVDDKKVYAPGEKGEILFRVTGVGTRSGLYRKKATVLQKPNKQTVAILTFAADIKRKARISPTYLNFGKVRPGQTLTAKLVVASGTDEPLTITGVATSLPGQLNVTYTTQTDRTGLAKYLCEVSLTGDGKERSLNETISFKTNCPDIDKIPVHVVADMVAPVIIKPQSLYFGKVSPGADISKSLHIISTSEQVLAFKGISSAPNDVQLIKASPSKDNGIDLTLLFTAPSETSGIARGTLSIMTAITTKDSEQAVIERTVPWMAVIERN